MADLRFWRWMATTQTVCISAVSFDLKVSKEIWVQALTMTSLGTFLMKQLDGISTDSGGVRTQTLSQEVVLDLPELRDNSPHLRDAF